MNLIKFIDQMIDGKDWYNDNLRNKYAYWLHCRYIIPLEEISKELAVSFETDIEPLLGYKYYVLSYLYQYVEMIEEPEDISDIPEYPLIPTGISIDIEEIYIKVDNKYYELNQSLVYKEIKSNSISQNRKDLAVLVEEVPINPSEDADKFIKTHNPEYTYIDQWDDNNDWILNVIDVQETEKINSVEEYMRSNEFTPENITLDELKNFRTWLAENLLVFKGELTDNQRHTLTYYAEGMTDETIKWLTEFGQLTVGTKITDGLISTCGCGGSSNVSSLYNSSVGLCDPINIYKTNLHRSMVEMFSDIDFWSDLNKGFLKEIVLYLEGILKAGLSLVVDTTAPSDSFSCRCLGNKSSAQEIAQSVIEDLIVSFNYIIHEDTSGHKLNILQTLSRWSDTLYEVMQWN